MNSLVWMSVLLSVIVMFSVNGIFSGSGRRRWYVTQAWSEWLNQWTTTAGGVSCSSVNCSATLIIGYWRRHQAAPRRLFMTAGRRVYAAIKDNKSGKRKELPHCCCCCWYCPLTSRPSPDNRRHHFVIILTVNFTPL